MSDGFDTELRLDARSKAAEAAAAWVNHYDVTEGSVVVGYVLIVESVRPNGEPDVTWCTGSGGIPNDANREWLAAWRVEGLVRRVLRDMFDGNASAE